MSRDSDYTPDDALQNSVQQAFSKAVSLHQKGQTDQAVQLYREILQKQPDHASSLHYLGLLVLERERIEEGISLIKRSLALAPNTSLFHNNYGLALEKTARLEEAISAFRRAIELNPDYPGTHCNLAKALINAERLNEAEIACRHALALSPHEAEAHNILGLIQIKQSHFNDAEFAFRRAIQLKENYAGAYNNLGALYRESGELEKEIQAIKRALKIDPNTPDFHYNLAYALLQSGDYKEGWREHEWRFQMKDISPRHFSQPIWRGEDLTDKKILVWSEQGVGDEIMFASMIPDMAATASHCLVECDQRLVDLFKRSFAHVDVVPRSDPAHRKAQSTEIAYQVAAGSLGLWFRTSLDSFPKYAGFLKPDSVQVTKLRRRYRSWSQGRPVVGLSWRSGSSISHRRTKRTLPLHQWQPILEDQRIAFVNVQYGDCRQEIASVLNDIGVAIYQDTEIDTFNDLDGLAAQLASLDLIISIDNSTVHLAGALGQPVWGLLPFTCDWRWLKKRPDSPWYPSLQLFRQSSPGDWASALTQASNALTHAIESRLLH